jgi:rhodanese-related sulfurtransferase
MRIILTSLALTLLLLGCKTESSASTAEPMADAAKAEAPAPAAEQPAEEVAIAEITVADADKALQSGAMAFDANSERTRKEYGTVPDAVILTSSSKYDLAQLPEDKSKDLIFYCSNTACTASDAAAERASANGYENVRIMREGIKGWKDAGKPTTPFTES